MIDHQSMLGQAPTFSVRRALKPECLRNHWQPLAERCETW